MMKYGVEPGKAVKIVFIIWLAPLQKIIATPASRGYVEIFFSWLITLEKNVNRDN